MPIRTALLLLLLGRFASAAAAPAAVKPDPAAIDWVRLPGGTFLMGADDGGPERKPRRAVLVKPFRLARTEVTFAQYRACIKAGACTPVHAADGCLTFNGKAFVKDVLPADFQADEQPVVCVDWNQAAAFSRWAGGRLPSEAEWEYAARGAGEERAYPWGNEPATCERAVMNDGGAGCGKAKAWPVCSKPAGNTPQGLCDMAGNVWEWTQDGYHPTYAGAPADARPWEDARALLRVRRGGGWRFDAAQLRNVNRRGDTPYFRGRGQGFRPARN